MTTDAPLKCAYFNWPTWANPHISRAWLKSKRAEMYERGEGAIWEREYGARRIKGGPNHLLPMWSEDLVRPHHEIMAELARDKHKLSWFVTADPGTSTCFAMLFSAFNPHTRTTYHLDEIYETDKMKTSTSLIIPAMRKIKTDLNEDGEFWFQTYDEAATWFAVEAYTSFEEPFAQTRKKELGRQKSDDVPGLSLIKDQCLLKQVVVSDRCVKLRWEISNYVKDKNNKAPTTNDHLIDCWRYYNQAAGIDFVAREEPPPDEYKEDRRGYKLGEEESDGNDIFAEYG